MHSLFWGGSNRGGMEGDICGRVVIEFCQLELDVLGWFSFSFLAFDRFHSAVKRQAGWLFFGGRIWTNMNKFRKNGWMDGCLVGVNKS